MTPDWAIARRWAEEQAQSWFAADEPYEVGDIEIGWPLQIAAFEAFLATASAGAGARSIRGLSPTRLIKREGLDRAVRSLALRLMTRGASGSDGTGGALFLSEIPTPSMMEPSLLVANKLDRGEVGVAVADPRSLRYWRTHGFDPRPIVLPIREEAARVASGRRDATRVWRRFVARDPRFIFAGRDHTRAALRALRPVILNSAPWLPAELEALRRIVTARSPDSIVVGSDQHRIGRLAAVVANETRTPLLVIQHGLPQTPIAFLPVVADRVAVWSEDVGGWFVQNGTPPEKIAVTGNPRLDSLAGSSREAARSRVSGLQGLGGTPRVLVALHPLDVATNLKVLDIALAAAREHPSSSTAIKLHPGQGDHRPITDLVGRSGLASRVRVFRHESLLPLLLWADLTLLHRTSVAVESLAAGTPVVVADVGGRSIAQDELLSLDLPMVKGAAAFFATMSELTSGAGSRAFFQTRATALERQIGPMDGMSARRIVDIIRSGGKEA